MLLPSKTDRLDRLMATRLNELLRRNQELERSLQARDAFIATLSHDLRSPLSGQLALMGSMLERLDDMAPEEVRDIVETVHASSATLYNLLENLVQWSALRTDEVGLTARRVDLAPVAGVVVQLHQSSAAQKDVRMIAEISEEAAAFADRRVVETVLRNLAANAVKFTPKGGEVRIQCFDEGYKVRVEVADTGPGMDPAVLRRLQLGSTGGGPGEGTGAGLGLGLCNELLSKYGGRLQAENQPEGGLRIGFCLPKG
jgi:signal transduction histidine kinase